MVWRSELEPTLGRRRRYGAAIFTAVLSWAFSTDVGLAMVIPDQVCVKAMG